MNTFDTINFEPVQSADQCKRAVIFLRYRKVFTKRREEAIKRAPADFEPWRRGNEPSISVLMELY